MICYTLSDCVLKNLNKDTKQKAVVNDLLFVFPKSATPHKLVIDSQQRIIDIYLSYDSFAIQFWLEQMGHEPASWESVETPDIAQTASNEEIFKTVCSQTEDKMLIVYNHNGWTKGKYFHKRSILHNNSPVRVLDRIEAMKLLSLSEEDAVSQISDYEKDLQKPMISQTSIDISNSIVAMNGSGINNAKIESK